MASVQPRTLTDGSKRYDVYYRDPDGHQRCKTFHRARAAEKFASTVETDKLRGDWIDPDAGRVLFEDNAAEWLSIQSFDPSTYEQVASRLRVHVLPVLGRRQLRNIRPSTIQGWLKTTEGLAESTRALIFGHVQTILNAAVDDELIRKNPCKAKSVSRPKPVHAKLKVWELNTAHAVRDALPKRYQVVSPMGVGLGMRQGEMFGFSPDDIDRGDGLVHIQRQVKLVGGKLVFAPPKYGKERDVPLSDAVDDWLTDYMDRFPPIEVTLPWKDPDQEPGKEKTRTVRLILTTRERNAVTKNTFNRFAWKPALIAAGVEPIRANGTHAQRHLFASLLLDAGESIKAVSEYLGHADPGFTLRVYTHLMRASHERTRRAIDQVFRAPAGLPNPEVAI